MDNKKNFLGIKMVVLLLFLLSNLVAFSTTCYADDISFKNLTGDDYSAIFSYIGSNISSWGMPNIQMAKAVTAINSLSQNSVKMSSLAQQISSYASDYGTIYQVVFAVVDVYGDLKINIYVNNNQIGDVFPFVKCWQYTSGSSPQNRIQYIDDNDNSVSYHYITINVDYINTNVSVTNQSASNGYNSTIVSQTASNFDIGNGVYFANFPCFFGIRQKNIAPYTNYNPTVYSKYISESSYIWRELKNSVEIVSMEYIEPTPEPEEPSGEDSTTGTITDSNGETTGKIDLSGIEQGIENVQNQISGDSQKVIENQNQNTQTIVNTISGEVGKISNTLTNVPDISNTQITSGDIERCFRF